MPVHQGKTVKAVNVSSCSPGAHSCPCRNADPESVVQFLSVSKMQNSAALSGWSCPMQRRKDARCGDEKMSVQSWENGDAQFLEAPLQFLLDRPVARLGDSVWKRKSCADKTGQTASCPGRAAVHGLLHTKREKSFKKECARKRRKQKNKRERGRKNKQC